MAQSLSLPARFPLGSGTDETYLAWVLNGDPESWKVLLLHFESRFFDVFDLNPACLGPSA
jgi:hypothetical protein